jgi:hypothetical protein
MRELIATAALLLIAPASASAQNTDHPYRGQGYLFFGFGFGTGSPSAYHPVIDQVGFGGEGFLYKGLGAGAEASYASWGGNYNTAWIGSGDISYHFGRHARRFKADPFVLGGVSIVGPTQAGGGRGSPAGNFGCGANLWIAHHAALRFEFRDVVVASFWNFDHVIAFRVGVTFR